MGSGYNDSLAASRGARTRASTRTPIHFYLTVPFYEYDLGCGRNAHLHTFQTRTPLVEADNGERITVWCSGCQEFRELDPSIEPLNRPISTDEVVAFEQDKGILRERIALTIQDIGFVENDAQIRELITRDWSLASGLILQVPNAEIKRINAGLRAPEGLSGLPDLCKAGLHEMSIDNIDVVGGYRTCKACRREKQRARRRDARSPSHNKRVGVDDS